jgi:hypothetical protein
MTDRPQNDREFDLQKVEVVDGVWLLGAVCRNCGAEHIGNVSTGLVEWQHEHSARCSKKLASGDRERNG